MQLDRSDVARSKDMAKVKSLLEEKTSRYADSDNVKVKPGLAAAGCPGWGRLIGQVKVRLRI